MKKLLVILCLLGSTLCLASCGDIYKDTFTYSTLEYVRDFNERWGSFYFKAVGDTEKGAQYYYFKNEFCKVGCKVKYRLSMVKYEKGYEIYLDN